MTRRINIISFLWVSKDWNPSLLFVLGSGVILNLAIFNYMIRVKKSPIYGEKLFNPTNSSVDWKLILGAACFGLGWGIGGLCPGPFLVMMAVFQTPIHVIWFICLLIGMFLASRLDACLSKDHKITTSEERNIKN